MVFEQGLDAFDNQRARADVGESYQKIVVYVCVPIDDDIVLRGVGIRVVVRGFDEIAQDHV